MIEGQWRAARALIGWSQGDLAQRIGSSTLTVKRLEAGGRVSDEMRQRAKAALASRKPAKPFDRVAARAELDGLIDRLGAASA